MGRKLKLGLVGASAKGGWSLVAHIPAFMALKNVELARLAEDQRVVTAIGLQGHYAPEILYLKRLFEEGWFGQVVCVKMSMQTKASSERASIKAWEDEKQRKATLFSIVGGHKLYYLTHIFGEILEVAGQLTTQLKELSIKETGAIVNYDIPDQIIVNGILKSGIPFSNNISRFHSIQKGGVWKPEALENLIIPKIKMNP